MAKNNIISFSDFVKKKRGELSIDVQLLNALSADIKSRPELIEWYNFQNILNKHKLFLHSLYTSNHRDKNSNSNAGYCVSFTEEHFDEHRAKISEANEWLERKTLLVDAKNCTFKNMASQLYGVTPRSETEAWKMFYEILLKSHNVVVISGISKSKIPSKKSDYARSIIKINDDAHLSNIFPASDIIFVDSATFLERYWKRLGTYITILT